MKRVGNIDFISAQRRVILEKPNIIAYESSNYSDVNQRSKRLNPDFEYVHKVSKGTQV